MGGFEPHLKNAPLPAPFEPLWQAFAVQPVFVGQLSACQSVAVASSGQKCSVPSGSTVAAVENTDSLTG